MQERIDTQQSLIRELESATGGNQCHTEGVGNAVNAMLTIPAAGISHE